MKKLLIIPVLDEIEKSLELTEKYGVGFEFNDFFEPSVLDSDELIDKLVADYNRHSLPTFRTVHGAFYDVTVFSPDKRIREISELRIRQNINVAKKIGAQAVVFHTNYNPFLNMPGYVNKWLEINESFWSGVLQSEPDMNIYLENMFEREPDIVLELSERLGKFDNYGICFDYAHAALTDTPHEEWVKKLGKYVKHMHINDNDLKSDGHLALGDGMINWNEFYSLYDKYLNSPTVLVEMSDIESQKKSLEKLKSDGFI